MSVRSPDLSTTEHLCILCCHVEPGPGGDLPGDLRPAHQELAKTSQEVIQARGGLDAMSSPSYLSSTGQSQVTFCCRAPVIPGEKS